MARKKKNFRVLCSPKKPCRPPNRPSKRICWSNEAMLGAIDAVKKNGTGVNAAAAQLEYHLPLFVIGCLVELFMVHVLV